MAKNGKAKPDWPANKIEMRPLAKIREYPNNPRTHPAEQIALLAANMKSVGVTMPILVDEDGVIIAGHGRKLGAAAAGFTEYPVAVAHGWSEEQKRSTRISDNSYGLLSAWDVPLIQAEIALLKAAEFDLPLLGFPETQLRGWGIALGNDGVADPEVTPDLPKKPVVRKGDLWILGDHRLLCGDATSKSDVEMCLDGAKPNLMVTDPPYGVAYEADWRDAALGGKSGGRARGKVSNDHQSDWREAWKLFPGDVVYCWTSGRFVPESILSLEAVGFERRVLIVWAKSQLCIGRGHYHSQEEECWYAVRKGCVGHWSGDRKQSTLWQINKPQKSETGHSTQKPIECMKRPIENNSRRGDFIYEPFSGSGTTIIACEMTGRKALAIEIDPSYVQVAVERWQAFTGKSATCGGQTLEQVAKARNRKAP